MGRAEDLFERLQNGGAGYLQQLVESAKSEEAFLEFKRSADDGAGTTLHPSDRNNLIRALSGFANSDGGVVVWGIGRDRSTGADAPTRMPVSDCRAFCARIDDQISGCTVPTVPGVRSVPILAAPDAPKGYVATLIPASPNAPHQTIDTKGYLIRAGSSFQPVNHNVLAGMFGRSPRPRIDLSFLAHEPGVTQHLGTRMVVAPLTPLLLNLGSVVAEDAYVTWMFRGPQSGCDVGINELPDERRARWQVDSVDSRFGSCLATPATRLAPNSQHATVQLQFRFHDGCPDFGMTLTYGCRGMPPQTLELSNSAAQLAEQFEQIWHARVHTRAQGQELSALTVGLLGLDRLAR